MLVTDEKIDKDAAVGREKITVPVETAVSLTDAEILEIVPGFAFEVVSIESYCRTKAGAVSAEVKVGGNAATATGVTFTAATRVANSLSATYANKRGSETDTLTVEITTDGTGALTNGSIVITIRPQNMRGDPSLVLD